MHDDQSLKIVCQVYGGCVETSSHCQTGLRIDKTLFREINSESQSSPAADLTDQLGLGGKFTLNFLSTLESKLTSFLRRQPVGLIHVTIVTKKSAINFSCSPEKPFLVDLYPELGIAPLTSRTDLTY